MPSTILLARPQVLVVARMKPYPQQGVHAASALAFDGEPRHFCQT